MDIATIAAPPMPTPTSTEYTWAQTWRFFVLGLLRALIVSAGPLVLWIWRWHVTSYDPINWHEFWIQAAGTFSAPAALYWHTHWKMLKLPSWAEIPDNFNQVPQP